MCRCDERGWGAATRRGARALAALAAASLLALAGPGGAGAQSEILAARVNGVGITVNSLERNFEEYLQERRLNIARMVSPNQVKEMKRDVLDTLIRRELLWQAAEKAGIVAPENEVDAALESLRARFRNRQSYLSRLSREGFTEEGYRAHLRKVLSGERYLEDVTRRAPPVTDEDVRAFYDANAARFSAPERVRIRHILVKAPRRAPEAERAQARERAAELLRQARSGADFETLARVHSEDVTKPFGGELDPFPRGQTEKPFEDAAFALAPGEISDIVETSAGFHVLRLEERIPAVSADFDSVKERIRAHLESNRAGRAAAGETERLKAAARIEVLIPL